MGLRRSQIFGLAGGVLLLALLPLPACKRRSLGGEDAGAGQGGSTGGLPSLDGGAGQGGSAIGGQGGTATGGKGGTGGTASPPDAALDTARDTGADMRRDAPNEVPPPPGFIPCGNTACDPAREFCNHWIGGLVPDARMCQRLVSGCAPGGTDCSCLLHDGSPPFCFACRVIAGTEAAGLELDCPGPID